MVRRGSLAIQVLLVKNVTAGVRRNVACFINDQAEGGGDEFAKIRGGRCWLALIVD